MKAHFLPLLVAFAFLAPLGSAFGWGEPHLAITKAALEALPPWQKELLGEEAAKLGSDYCLIPDHVYTDTENAKFAMMDDKPRERYLLILHLPAQQPENLETMRYFMGKAVDALRAGHTADAARYMGTVCHQLEDYGSPAHTVPGDNMFTLLQQFLPPTDAMKDQLLHGPIENGDLHVDIQGYKPTLLGTTVEEASWRLLHRVHDGILNARSTTIPIIQALYAEDKEGVTKHQMKAATMDAKVVADAFYTILCLGAQKFDAAEQEPLHQVEIDSFFPLEAVNLYYPQTQFFSTPNWGYPHTGVVLAEGKKAVPLKLSVEEKAGGAAEEKEFAHGLSVGMGRSLTYLLPKGVYTRFTVLAGLHPELGAKGRVEFTISGDGQPLASATVSGTDPAHAFECDISHVSQLQLTVVSRGTDAKSNYAIWADPMLVKP
ncbi:MAG: NPCBM/NEW2 domain-containing protein [Chthoniobacter sp.]|nr:NPCBM/NEW2 domain-containing protein [Chthoniobacter sp.]